MLKTVFTLIRCSNRKLPVFRSFSASSQTVAEGLNSLASLFQRLVGGGVGDAEE